MKHAESLTRPSDNRLSAAASLGQMFLSLPLMAILGGVVQAWLSPGYAPQWNSTPPAQPRFNVFSEAYETSEIVFDETLGYPGGDTNVWGYLHQVHFANPNVCASYLFLSSPYAYTARYSRSRPGTQGNAVSVG